MISKMSITNKSKFALITGASAGIGLATAEALAKSGYGLLLTARRKERLSALQKHLKKKYGITVEIFPFDISKKTECDKFFTKNKQLLSQVSVLVNNAGLARGSDLFQEAKIEDFEEMIDTNIKGLLYLTRAIVPNMQKNGLGHIINLGSVAGRWVYQRGHVYCATKFFVRALSEGLRMDLLGSGIRVTNIEPGMVETEFSEVRLRDKERAKKVYQGMKPLAADDIARAIVWCVEQPPHVNIQELVIFPTDQASITHVHRQ
jgi:NADP-dependent 3-hydroxy acid dehydrogenase YdfG